MRKILNFKPLCVRYSSVWLRSLFASDRQNAPHPRPTRQTLHFLSFISFFPRDEQCRCSALALASHLTDALSPALRLCPGWQCLLALAVDLRAEILRVKCSPGLHYHLRVLSHNPNSQGQPAIRRLGRSSRL